MMKRDANSEAGQLNTDKMNISEAKLEKLDRRTNLDEIARYVIEGRNRRKKETQNYGSNYRAKQ